MNSRQKYSVWITVCVYIVAYCCLSNKFYYNIGPDYTSYYAIAKHYASGNFIEAINTWWSPLFSWLITPFIFFDIDALLINKIVQCIIGIYGLIIMIKLLHFFLQKAKQPVYSAYGFALITFTLFWTLTADTPDSLVAVLLLHLLLLLLNLSDLFNKQKAITVGLASGLAFLAKSFNFYFMSCFGLVMVISFFIFSKKNNRLKSFLFIGFGFVVPVLFWVCCMYVKTNKVLLTSRAEHTVCQIDNNKLARPTQPFDCVGLQLDSTSMYSDWEQPQLYKASGFGNLVTPSRYLLKKITNNAVLFFTKYIVWYQLLLLLFLVLGKFTTLKKYFFISAFFVGIYVGGHFIFHLENRFFIMPYTLLFILSIVSSSVFTRQYIVNQKWQSIVLGCTTVLLCVNSIKRIYFYSAPVVLNQIMNISTTLPNHTRIAADIGLFEEALYVAFFTNSKCLGALQKPYNDTTAIDELTKVNATHLLIKKADNEYALLPLVNGKPIGL